MGYTLVARKKGRFTKEELTQLSNLDYGGGSSYSMKEKGEYAEFYFGGISSLFTRIPLFFTTINWNIDDRGRFITVHELRGFLERWKQSKEEKNEIFTILKTIADLELELAYSY
jgi:hypothetical protein